jgi:imidazolonepropionase-like amidohydrolase
VASAGENGAHRQRGGHQAVAGDDYGVPIIPHALGAWSADFATYVDQVGIKPLDSLRWATRNMASLMEMEGQLGTIAPGALADVVVLRDDPSDDVTILQDPAANVLAVLKDGEFVVDRLPAV